MVKTCETLLAGVMVAITFLNHAAVTDAQPDSTPDSALPTAQPITILPHGLDAGDSEVESLAGPINLSTPITLYNKILTSIYISQIGIMSSVSGVSNLGDVEHFPRVDDSMPLIAPLWTDFRSVTTLYRVTNDSDTLQLVRDMIVSRNPALSDYQPSVALVVTMEEVEIEFHQHLDINFQAVLSTDGQASFAAFTYSSPNDVLDITARWLIGFDAGDEVRGSVVLSGEEPTWNGFGNVNIFRIDGNCVTTIEGDDVCGLDSQSTGCSEENNLATINCQCYPGVVSEDCEDSVEFTCPEYSDYFPECSDEFPVCIFSSMLCDRIADCQGAADELPSLCGFNFTFLPYGPGIGDDERNINDAYSTFAGNASVPIIFFRQEHQEVFVTSYGLISFHYHYTSPSVESFPRTAFPKLPLIATLWTTFEEQRLGIFFYRLTDDPENLRWARQLILSENPDLDGYQPLLALIVTWHEFLLPAVDIPITFQAIVTTDGRASFVALVYTNDGVLDIEDLPDAKLVGFDAGDGTRSATVLSHGFSSIENLTSVNVFRVDGHCITTALPGEVCDLDSYAVDCDVMGLTATTCRCYQDTNSNNNTTCEANAAFQCDAGSIPSVCPEGDSEFLGCFPENFICNLDSNCPGGADEINCTDSGFFPFGEGAGDSSNRVYDDNNAVTLFLDVPMIFYNTRQTEVYASTNGVLSFGEAFESYMVTTLPRITMALPLMAVLWRDFDFSFSGSVYHRQANDTETLAQVRSMIADVNPGLSDYQPILAVIVTWFEAKIHFDFSEFSLTFQVVLSTDGNVSFAALVYQDPSDVMPLYQVGFDAGDRMRGVNLLGTDSINWSPQRVNIFRIDGSCITTAQPGGVCGLEAETTECDPELLTATVCTCQAGYEHRGLECSDVNECETSLHNCGQNSQCNNADGGFWCACEPGYSGDGLICEAFTTVPEANSESSSSQTVIGVVVAMVVLFALAVLSAIVVIVAVRRRRKVKKKHGDALVLARTDTQVAAVGNEYFHQLKKISVASKLNMDVAQSLILNSCNLQLGKTIGQGEFGIVYKALLKKGFNQPYSDTVAVKTLKGFFDEDLVDDLLRECTKMQEFDHPNVLTLIGVCLDGGPAPYIVMPFMTGGSLLSHLKENRKLLVLDPASTECDDSVDPQKKLLDMCIQVAKGMEYLAGKRVVHRDLAARNCMIDSNFMIKVADFGLSESMDITKEYFRQNKDQTIKLPIKWLAIESINDGIFSEKTDVWAYGVTCWEVFTGGKTPYPGVHPLELSRQLEIGYRMEKPLNATCSDEIYATIVKCWNSEPDLRPRFSELVTLLSAFLHTMADYFDFTAGVATAGI